MLDSRRRRLAFLAGVFVFTLLPELVSALPPLGPDGKKRPSNLPPGVTRQQLRNEWFYKKRVAPDGTVPPRARELGISALQQMPLTPLQARTENFYSPLSGAVQSQKITTPWVFAGPRPMSDTGDVYGNGNSSVRVNAIAVHPTDAATLYIGTSYAGIAKSTDSGLNWNYLTDGLPSQAISTIVIDTTAPNIIYAGTGDAYNFTPRGQHLLGVGIYRSTDSGATWGRFASSSFEGYVIRQLAVDPATSGSLTATILYAAVSDGPSSTSRGIWKSLDSGQTWARINTGVGFNASAYDVVVATGAVTPTVFMSNQIGAYKTTDAGANWSAMALTGGAGISPDNPNQNKARLAFAKGVLYYTNSTGTYSSAQAPLYSYASNGSPSVSGNLWKSTDLGATWARVNAAKGFCGGQCFYDQYVSVDPNDPNHVYVGGVDASLSNNGGTSFTNYASFNPPAMTVHSDQHALAVAPSNSAILYNGNDGGVARSADSGATWANKNLFLSGGLFVGISLSGDGSIVGGLQDNGSRISTGSFTWRGLTGGGGDGGFSRVDSGNSLKSYHTYVTGGSVAAQLIRRTTNGGADFTAAGVTDITPAAAIGAEGAEFYAPTWLDATNSANLMIGLQHVYRSADSGTNWTRIGAVNTPAGAGNNIFAVVRAPSDAATIWACAGNNRCYKTTNAGNGNSASWTDMTGTLPTAQAPTAIAIHPTDVNTVYVTYSQYGTVAAPLQHIYKTANGGTTWASAGVGLPDVPVNDLVIDTVAPSSLFAASDVGVYNSLDAGLTWMRSDTGMPMGMIAQSLSLQSGNRKLAVGTYGRGVYTLTLPAAPPVPTGLACAVQGTSSITWTWNASAAQYNVQAYGVYYATNPTVLVASVTTPSFTFQGLAPGTAVSLQVTAANGVLESANSATVSATTTLGPGQPGPPVGTPLGVSSISWTWAAASGAVSYNLFTASAPAVLLTNTAATTFIVIGLATNTAYGLIVNGVDINGAGLSNSSSLTSTLTAPPTGFALVAATTSTLSFKWGPNGNPAGTSFRFDYTPSGGAMSSITSTKTTASLGGLLPNATYTVTVGALNNDGILNPSGITFSTQTMSVSSVTTTVSAGAEATVVYFAPAGPVMATIPAGAFAADINVTMSTPTSFPSAVSNAGSLAGTGVGVQIELSQAVQPRIPVTLSVGYRDSDIAGLDARLLLLARYDPGTGTWVPLVSTPDPAGNRVVALVDHFSAFQVMQGSPSDSVDDAKAFPNPMRPSQGHTSMTFARLPANARIRIYTLSGALIRDLNADATGMARWDGTNQTGARAASGVYFVYAQGKGKRRTLKVAIQR